MAYNGKTCNITIQASADLSDTTAGTGKLYKAIANTGTLSAAAGSALGILQYGADDTGNVTLAVSGESKYVAGGAIASGGKLALAADGYLAAASSGSTVVGVNLPAAVTSGSVGTGIFNFATPYVVVNSNGI